MRFDTEALKLINSYLKGRKQYLRIIIYVETALNHYYVYHKVVFNIFPNVLFLFVRKISLHNYADYNTLCVYFTDVASLMKLQSEDSNINIDWLILNHMIISPKKL